MTLLLNAVEALCFLTLQLYANAVTVFYEKGKERYFPIFEVPTVSDS